jgi:outer membrane protein TolC
MRLASELRPELEQSDLAVANREVELERSRDQLKPALELVAGYQQFGLGGTQVIRDFSRGFIDAPIVAIIPGGLGDSLSQVFSGDFYGYVLGFNLQVPLANTDARARNAQARIELNRAHMQRLAQEQLVGLEIRDTLTQIEMNRARLQAAEAAVRAARERLEGEQARFEVGMGTTRQLIEAQRDLLQAESVVVRARTDLAKNYSQLDRAVGRTFQRFNLVLTDALGRNVK